MFLDRCNEVPVLENFFKVGANSVNQFRVIHNGVSDRKSAPIGALSCQLAVVRLIALAIACSLPASAK